MVLRLEIGIDTKIRSAGLIVTDTKPYTVPISYQQYEIVVGRKKAFIAHFQPCGNLTLNLLASFGEFP
jgi:hypothetical protein